MDAKIDDVRYREELTRYAEMRNRSEARHNTVVPPPLSEAKDESGAIVPSSMAEAEDALGPRQHSNSTSNAMVDAEFDALSPDEAKEKISTADAIELFQKLLKNVNGAGGGEESKAGENSSSADEQDSSSATPAAENQGTAARIAPPATVVNGRQTCNLLDHPVHAGCTAIVSIIVDKTIYCANAGDSRAVMCRKNGSTFPLSYDHKPENEGEMTRIKGAGGFVNQFGRVNGNLNLSRSIGDLKYKQNPDVAKEDQMITSEPDIISTDLCDTDEFIVLGCDGIWDCLSNEQAVAFVRERIDTKTPTEIVREMLDQVISKDPKETQGIGGDNMTCIIVDLQPSKRPYN
jgi:serine/threonine protein phosphatase PrpC